MLNHDHRYRKVCGKQRDHALEGLRTACGGSEGDNLLVGRNG
jgi:hypothetical protein